MNATIAELAELIGGAGPIVVLTGAGVSTASGIPEYRDRNGEWKHARPVQFSDFVRHAATRRRYWARSFAGWQRVFGADPNTAHTALAQLERDGVIDTLITQNVDGLHQRAGSERVIDLHGKLGSVVCLDCGARMPRSNWQDELLAENPSWESEVSQVKPDGDAELDVASYDTFTVPACRVCSGIVKPDVVFFGESVPRDRVAEASAAVARSGALLVVGSSLMVYSGLRFVRQASQLGIAVAIINRGTTRADADAQIKIDADCGMVLESMLASLATPQHASY